MTTQQTYREIALPLHQQGYEPLPVAPGSKAVFEKGWPTVEINEEWIAARAANGKGASWTGLRTGNGCVMLDVDVTNEEVAERIKNAITMETGGGLVRIGKAPKFGIVYRTNDVVTKRKWEVTGENGEKYGFIELLGKGQQFVAFGLHADTGKPYVWTNGSPLDTPLEQVTELSLEELIGVVTESVPDYAEVTVTVAGGASGALVTTDSDGWLANHKEPDPTYTIEKLWQDFGHLDPDMGHDDWLALGMAAHHQFGNGPHAEEALAAWDDWSSGGVKYNSDCQYRWGTFGEADSGRSVTIATLLRMVKEQRKKNSYQLRDKFFKEINDFKDVAELEERLPKMAAEVMYDSIVCDSMATLAKKKYQELCEVPISITAIRKLVKRPPASAKRKETPYWGEGLAFVASVDRFTYTDRGAKTMYTRSGIDGKLTHNVPVDPDTGFRMSASRYLLEGNMIPIVDRLMYAPGADSLFSYNGEEFLNSYREADIEMPDTLTPDMTRVIDQYMLYVAKMFPIYKEREMLLDFLAFQVQHPGVKIRWSIILKGVHGDGKSLIASDMMRAVLGTENVTIIGSKLIASDFTGWAEGFQFGVVEELKLHGHNRYDAANGIKTYITNDTISVHRKGIDAYVVPNTANYIALTNYVDPIPIEPTERRWSAIFSALQSKEDIYKAEKESGVSLKEVYADLREHPGVWKKWLMSRQISPDFDPNGQAPMTESLRNIIALSKSVEDEAIESVLEEKALGVGENVIHIPHLLMAIEAREGLRLNSQLAIRYLSNNYWDRVGRWKWRGQRGVVMVKNTGEQYSEVATRDLLAKTEENFESELE